MVNENQDKDSEKMSDEKDKLDFSHMGLRESLLRIGANWLNAQNFNNLLLLAIIGLIAYGGRYAITIAIPEHLKTIQVGYERIEDSHSRERTTAEELHSREREQAIKTYDKWFERFLSPQKTSVNE